jgi:hypothetical protein
MRCLYCGGPVVASKGLAESEFCSNDHRFRYEAVSRLARHEYLLPVERPAPAVGRTVLLSARRWIPRERSIALPDVGSAPDPADFALKATDELYSLVATWSFQPVGASNACGPVHKWMSPRTPPEVPVLRIPPRVSSRSKSYGWQPMLALWRRVPAYIKLTALIVPLILTAARHGWFTTYELAKARHGVQGALSTQWTAIGAHVRRRAAIDFTDDFRAGLDEWRSRSNAPANWSYDTAGFVRPGPLAIYRPTLDLTDYQFEFLAQIDEKALGFVFRAADLNNYYAVNFVVAQPGPLPIVEIVRYTVIQSREGPHVVRRLAIPVRNDMWYRVRLDVRGHDFTLNIQDQVADYWSESRLRQGGVGFFCGRGERARLRWVEVSHQHDTLGKLCAYLAPNGVRIR